MAAGAAARSFRDRPGIHAFREIGAGAEGPALGREHDHPASRVGIEPFESLADFGDQLAVKEIMRRPAHLDLGDVALLADTDVSIRGEITHLALSSISR